MDPIRNPFSPGAGSPPPELVGRDAILERAKIILGRTLARRSEKSLMLIGLRGVGKTVLLNRVEEMAARSGHRVMAFEAHESNTLSMLLAPCLRKLFFDLDRMAGFSEKVRRALATLKSFVKSVKVNVGEIEIGFDIEPERGMADSGNIEIDLPNLFCVAAEAAQDRGVGVTLLIDEIQYLSTRELSALIMAAHKTQQKQYPFALMGAGLPILPRLAGESKSYAERLFEFSEIGPLSASDAAKAVRDPILAAESDIKRDALDEIVERTRGYPYFLQEWGYQSWNRAEGNRITLNDVRRATNDVIQRLGANFFRVRFDRLTPREKDYLRAMAHLSPATARSGDIADALGVKMSAIAPVRAKLVNKGMIYSPAYGDMAFTVPLFDEFIRRAMPKS